MFDKVNVGKGMAECRETVRDGAVDWANHQACSHPRLEGGRRGILQKLAVVCRGAFDSPVTSSS